MEVVELFGDESELAAAVVRVLPAAEWNEVFVVVVLLAAAANSVSVDLLTSSRITGVTLPMLATVSSLEFRVVAAELSWMETMFEFGLLRADSAIVSNSDSVSVSVSIRISGHDGFSEEIGVDEVDIGTCLTGVEWGITGSAC
jgi:hypothetical protein